MAVRISKRAKANAALKPNDAVPSGEAVATLKKFNAPKFDQTVNVCMHLNIDPAQADANTRRDFREMVDDARQDDDDRIGTSCDYELPLRDGWIELVPVECIPQSIHRTANDAADFDGIGGRAETTCPAVEQRVVQRGAQAAQGVADGRLRQVQPGAGPCHASLGIDRLEYHEQV